MPNILHPSTLLQSAPLKFNETSGACNFDNPGANTMEQTQAEVADIKECVDKYDDFITDKLNEDDAAKMIRFSNFRIEDIQAIIEQNLDCGFLRVYNCIDSEGNHFQMITPVMQDANGFTKQDNITKYVVECCHCQPNCGSGTGKGFQ